MVLRPFLIALDSHLRFRQNPIRAHFRLLIDTDFDTIQFGKIRFQLFELRPLGFLTKIRDAAQPGFLSRII